jgi:hypothetical protein
MNVEKNRKMAVWMEVHYSITVVYMKHHLCNLTEVLTLQYHEMC